MLPPATPVECVLPIEITPSQGPKTDVNTPDLSKLADVVFFLFGVSCSPVIEPFGLGCNNRIFLLTLEVLDGDASRIPKHVLVRVSQSWKADSDISLESEVATMVYVKYHTTIPVPTVYGYCKDEHNPVGCQFIILEVMEGERMVDGPGAWEGQSPEFKQVAVRDYARIVSELSRLRFDSIGSLYFSKTKSGEFEVGPIAWCKWNTSYRRTLPVYDRGPWKTVVQMAEAGLKDNLQFLAANPALARKIPFPYSDDTEIWNSAVTNTRRGLEILPQVIDEASASGPFVLTHADLSMWNMLYAPSGPNAGKITAVIDWEMASTLPLWWLLGSPDWFRHTLFEPRDPAEVQLFESVYLEELEKQGVDTRPAQNAHPMRGFVHSAMIPWSQGSGALGRWEERYKWWKKISD